MKVNTGCFAVLALGAALIARANAVPMLNAVEEEAFLDNEFVTVKVTGPEREIVLKQTNVTAEVYADAMIAAWNKKILPKLKAFEELSPDDISAIRAVLDAQITMLDSLSFAFCDGYAFYDGCPSIDPVLRKVVRGHLVGKGMFPSVANTQEGGTNFEWRVIQAYTESKSHSLKSVSRFCDAFSPVFPAYIMLMFDFCCQSEEVFTRKGFEPWELFESWEQEWSVVGVVAPNLFQKFIKTGLCEVYELYANCYAGYKALYGNMELCGEELYVKDIKALPKDISTAWQSAEAAIIPRLKVLRRMQIRLKEYADSERLIFPKSKSAVDAILSEFEPLAQKSRHTLCVLLYDLPFVMLTFKTSADYRKCKGYIDDDEEKMEAVMRRYAESINGAHYLRHVTSVYGTELYRGLLYEVKSDLESVWEGLWFSDRFEALKASTRLIELGKRARKEDELTGLMVNEFTKEGNE